MRRGKDQQEIFAISKELRSLERIVYLERIV